MPDPATKRCNGCGEVKPVGEFGARADRGGRPKPRCRECAKDQGHRYYYANPEAACESSRRYYYANPEASRERNRRRNQAQAEQQAEYQRQRTMRLKAQVLAHYGTVCACCGTTEKLSIDHKGGDGKRHREENVRSGGAFFYYWLVQQGFPDGYQTLCMRCNTSKGRGVACVLRHHEDTAAPVGYRSRNISISADQLTRLADAALPGEGLSVTIRRLLDFALDNASPD